MRYQGKIKLWKGDKGFGFVSQNGGGNDVFLHISSFKNRTRRPVENDIVTYELVSDDKGRQQAKNVLFLGEKLSSKPHHLGQLKPFLILLIIIGFVVYIGYLRVIHPNSTISSTLYKVVGERSALTNKNNYQCAGKKYCSEMTSCDEALFYQENCSGTQMDGDHDGIPCEQQWCR